VRRGIVHQEPSRLIWVRSIWITPRHPARIIGQVAT
jgi:hypothetical protein